MINPKTMAYELNTRNTYATRRSMILKNIESAQSYKDKQTIRVTS